MKTDSGDLRITPKQDEKRELAGKIKRKAMASPDVITPSDEDIGKESAFPRNTPVALRKTRPKKKRTQAAVTRESVDPFSVRSSDTERSSGTNSMKQKKTSGEISKPKPGESGKFTRSKGRKKEDSIIISSEDEETGKDFAPQDLRIMEAINVGSLGLDCLANVDRMRSRSKNLQGGISGKMRGDLKRAREVINTLIYKAESTGDPNFLKIKNKELSVEMDRMKLDEVFRKREMDEIKGQFDELRNEIAELKRRLEKTEDRRDEAEEDRRKARESLRITDWKWRNKGYKLGELRKKGKVEDNETGGEPGKTEDGAYSPPPSTTCTQIECRTEDIRDNNTQIRDNSGNRSESKEVWVNVNRRWKGSERRREQVRGDLPARQNPGYTANREPENNNVRTGKTIGLKRKPLKNAAVMITSYKEELTYAEVIKMAREKISLDELRIQSTLIRRAANGGMIIEVLGSDSRDRADALAEKLKTIFQNQVKVVRPMVRGEIRLVGFDDSVSVEEVKHVVAQNGECKEEETKAGPIRKMNNGLFTVWVQCPLSAAIKMANRKKVRIGWILARVLENRPIRE
ncbi:uncharacterized protein [Polyergus mexicanus]|uniref:uncharacterized protein n=1 Tax=Polyergus mexicanus TaxID=615972 RepID=UPI0038B48465